MEKIAIIGVGMMGPGIAAVSALAGHDTVLVHQDEAKARAGVERARANIEQLAAGGLTGAEAAATAAARLRAVTDLEAAVGGADIVIEAIAEDLARKQELFAHIDRVASPDAIIASNTSGLRISDIAARVRRPERTITTHFWFPGHLVPLVEVVVGDRSSPAVAERVRDLLAHWGKAPVVVKRDLPGQLANRILQAIIRESVNIVASGIATAEDVDTAIKAGMAMRFPVWGPLEHIDAVGLDLARSVQQTVLPGLNNDSAPSPLLSAMVERGELGHKSGAGFYDWRTKDMKRLAACRDTFIMETVRLLARLKEEGRCG